MAVAGRASEGGSTASAVVAVVAVAVVVAVVAVAVAVTVGRISGAKYAPACLWAGM